MTKSKRQGGVGRILQRLGGLAYELTPQVFAVASFCLGGLMLLSAVTPAFSGRLQALDRLTAPILIDLSHFAASVTGFLLLLVGYTVAYFGVLTPDRVVRYRLLRFFMRGPVVAILIIAAILVIPKVEVILGLPRDVILFGVITGVINEYDADGAFVTGWDPSIASEKLAEELKQNVK